MRDGVSLPDHAGQQGAENRGHPEYGKSHVIPVGADQRAGAHAGHRGSG